MIINLTTFVLFFLHFSWRRKKKRKDNNIVVQNVADCWSSHFVDLIEFQLPLLFKNMRVYFRVTNSFTRKTMLVKAPYHFNGWLDCILSYFRCNKGGEVRKLLDKIKQQLIFFTIIYIIKGWSMVMIKCIFLNLRSKS